MAEEPAKFPEVQGGGSLIIAWQIKGKKVLVVGGGEVSSLTFTKEQISRADIFHPSFRSPPAVSCTVSMPTPT